MKRDDAKALAKAILAVNKRVSGVERKIRKRSKPEDEGFEAELNAILGDEEDDEEEDEGKKEGEDDDPFA